MSDYTTEPTRCEAMQEDLTELALGTLSGRSRSEVLDHVESCSRCQSELEWLSIVADTVLQLAPEAEPPVGFESRLAERLRGSSDVRRLKHRRRASVLTAAALLAAVLGFGLGTLVTARSTDNVSQTKTANLISTSLNSQGHVLGEVFVSAGNPAWMFMTIDSGTPSGVVWCEVTLTGGRVETIGQFNLSGGYAAWGAPLKSPAGQVRTARLIAANGTVLASAILPA